MNELAALVVPYWSEGRAREALRLTDDELAERIAAHSILVVTADDGTKLLPTWQFETRSGRLTVRPSLLAFFWILREYDGSTVGTILRTAADDLDGLTPEHWARERRDADTLVGLAHRLRAELRAR